MQAKTEKTLSGELFDDSTEITIVELCRVCSVDTALVEDLIEEGVLQPVGTSKGAPLFPYSSVRRTRMVVRMQRDLGVNLPGAAVALDLIERIHALQRRSRRG